MPQRNQRESLSGFELMSVRRVAPDWDLWRTLYRLSYSAVARVAVITAHRKSPGQVNISLWVWLLLSTGTFYDSSISFYFGLSHSVPHRSVPQLKFSNHAWLFYISKFLAYSKRRLIKVPLVSSFLIQIGVSSVTSKSVENLVPDVRWLRVGPCAKSSYKKCDAIWRYLVVKHCQATAW